MTWVPLADSGSNFSFEAFDEHCSLSGSTVTTLLGPDDPGSEGWFITFDEPRRVRVSIQSFQGIGNVSDPGNPSRFYTYWDNPFGEAFVPNETFPPNAFTPNPLDTDAYSGGPPVDFLQYEAGGGGGEGGSGDRFSMLIEVWQEGPEPPSDDLPNCECEDDTSGYRTMGQLRADLMSRLGYGAQAANPPPGMAALLNSFLQDAQRQLYRRYDVLRTERFFSWPLTEGVRMYDIPDNQESCDKKLDSRKVNWVGVEKDGIWYPLLCGIPPELYSHDLSGRPERYEIRQCIEVWPLPDETRGRLIIKGRFGLEPFTEDEHHTTIDDQLVFLLALANAKAHYRQPDANNYVAQLETMMVDLVAGSHHTRRYVPGKPSRWDGVYVQPRPTVPWP